MSSLPAIPSEGELLSMSVNFSQRDMSSVPISPVERVMLSMSFSPFERDVAMPVSHIGPLYL